MAGMTYCRYGEGLEDRPLDLHARRNVPSDAFAAGECAEAGHHSDVHPSGLSR